MARLGILEAAQIGDRFQRGERVQEEKGERRQNRRYDLKLELRWKTIQRHQVTESGVGNTLDLSSGGVRFTAGSDLLIGSNVALSIVWPALLHDVAPMLLAIQGTVVRSAKGWAAVRILQHEFRIQGIPREQATAPVRNRVSSRLRRLA